MTVGMPKDIPIAIAIRSLMFKRPRAEETVGVAVAVSVAIAVAVAVAVAVKVGVDLSVMSVEGEKLIEDVGIFWEVEGTGIGLPVENGEEKELADAEVGSSIGRKGEIMSGNKSTEDVGLQMIDVCIEDDPRQNN